MTRRQSLPERWLITDWRMGDGLLTAIRRLPPGNGIVFRAPHLDRAERAKLLGRVRRLAVTRRLQLIEEGPRGAVRVHDAREVRRARLSGARILLVSPIFATRSHPGARPLRRMQAAALARLAGEQALALGGMNARRFRRIGSMGFAGWVGIDAWTRRRD